MAIAIMAFFVAYSILRRRVSHKLEAPLEDLEKLSQQSPSASGVGESCVPPMRIHLEFTEDDLGQFGSRGAMAEHWLRGKEFRFLGQFVIEEMQDEQLRGFAHQESSVLALIRFPYDAGQPYVEFSTLLSEDELAGVANPPRKTLQLPEDAPGEYFFEDLSIDLLNRMWEATAAILLTHSVLPVPQDQVAFAELFERAHAAELDYRMERGGLSSSEIEETFAQQGIVASSFDIDAIQQQWQVAIEKHLMDFSSKASNCYYSGRQVLIVYEGSQHRYLLSRLGELLGRLDSIPKIQQEQLLASFAELRQMLDSFSPREAMARFRAHLPREMRYDLIDQLQVPLEADCYVLPSSM